MKIKFVLDEYDILFEQNDATCAPNSGDMVYLEEIFFVDSVVWYPSEDTAQVNLKDEPPKKTKVAEIKEDVVKLNDITQAKTDAKQALKETDRLKRELFSVRQYLKSDKESKK